VPSDDRLGASAGDADQVLPVGRQEPFHGVQRGRQPLELVLHRVEVVEAVRDVGDEVGVELAEPGGQRGREVVGVELPGEVRAAQREQQVEEAPVAGRAEPEQRAVDRGAELLGGVEGRAVVQALRELSPAEGDLVLRELEVVADPLGRDEEPRVGVTVHGRRGADADRGVRGAVGELHPHVPGPGVVAEAAGPVVVVTAEQQRLHRPRPAHRVHARRAHHSVEEEREQQRQGVGLARPVAPAQHQPSVAELEDVVVVLPDVEDPRAGRLPAHQNIACCSSPGVSSSAEGRAR